MSIVASPRFLRNVLFADAASCVATGALQLLFTAPLAELLNLPAALLMGTGWFLLAYAATVGLHRDARSTAARRWSGCWWPATWGGLAPARRCWPAAGSRPRSWGEAWILAQAATVAVLAELQWTGLRRTRGSGWA